MSNVARVVLNFNPVSGDVKLVPRRLKDASAVDHAFLELSKVWKIIKEEGSLGCFFFFQRQSRHRAYRKVRRVRGAVSLNIQEAWLDNQKWSRSLCHFAFFFPFLYFFCRRKGARNCVFWVDFLSRCTFRFGSIVRKKAIFTLLNLQIFYCLFHWRTRVFYQTKSNTPDDLI